MSEPNHARAVLSFAGLNLLLAPGDLRTIESASDLTLSDPPEHALGWIDVLEQRCPVFALSSDLAPTRQLPEGRGLCAIVDHGDGLSGLLCEGIRVIKDGIGPLRPLPPAMRRPDSPIQAVAPDGPGILCAVDVRGLARHLERASLIRPGSGQIATGTDS